MRRGTAGVESMNQQLQILLNPAREEIPEISRHARAGSPVFRFNDRVIQTINNYEREVFNGDPGRVVAVDPVQRSLVVEFQETDFVRITEGESPPAGKPTIRGAAARVNAASVRKAATSSLPSVLCLKKRHMHS